MANLRMKRRSTSWYHWVFEEFYNDNTVLLLKKCLLICKLVISLSGYAGKHTK